MPWKIPCISRHLFLFRLWHLQVSGFEMISDVAVSEHGNPKWLCKKEGRWSSWFSLVDFVFFPQGFREIHVPVASNEGRLYFFVQGASNPWQPAWCGRSASGAVLAAFGRSLLGLRRGQQMGSPGFFWENIWGKYGGIINHPNMGVIQTLWRSYGILRWPSNIYT